jgi:hypothetical protein
MNRKRVAAITAITTVMQQEAVQVQKKVQWTDRGVGWHQLKIKAR